MLDPIHNQRLRLALRTFRTSPVASPYVEADEPSLYSRREKLSLQYDIRLAANPFNPAHESKKEGKDQDSIHSSTTTDQGYQWESDNVTIRHHKREPRGQPFPSR